MLPRVAGGVLWLNFNYWEVCNVSTVAERVDAGVEFLDAHRPGWRDEIIEPLDMDDCLRCVLGQVCGKYWSADLWQQIGTVDDAKRLGFYATSGRRSEYRQLTTEWKTRL